MSNPFSTIIGKNKSKDKVFEPPLDKGIEKAVLILNQFGVETYESCQGGVVGIPTQNLPFVLRVIGVRVSVLWQLLCNTDFLFLI